MRALRFSVLLGVAVAAMGVVAGGAAASPGTPHASDVVGHVYVNDNTAPVNSIAGFDRHADGSLTPAPGSPFSIGGSGTGHPDASQGSLQLSADGRYLLAVDAGSNQISVLRIKPDGALQAVEGSPVASGGGVHLAGEPAHLGRLRRDVGADRLRQPCARAGGALLERRDALERRADHRQQQVGLAAEVTIECPDREAGPRGDVLHGGGVVSALGEQLGGRGQDAIAGRRTERVTVRVARSAQPALSTGSRRHRRRVIGETAGGRQTAESLDRKVNLSLLFPP